MERSELKQAIIDKSRAVGFDRIGFAAATLPAEVERLSGWLDRGYHGDMAWMERRAERRTDQALNHPHTQTVVCCTLNYYQGEPDASTGSLEAVVSSYARGEDYHRVLGDKLAELAAFIEDCAGVPTKWYVDTGPILEKPYAARAGLGWMGKHSNLLATRGSSWFFLGEILVPLALAPDEPTSSHCGTCTRCMTECPTDAIVEPYVVDSNLCISYLTIEHRGVIPRKLRSAMGNRIYGCDDCQDVCPWNRFAKKSDEARFFAREPLASMDLVAMLQMSRDAFMEATRGSAIRRARYGGFLRNVAIALGNSGDPRAVDPLIVALAHEEPLVRAHASWALAELHAVQARPALMRRLNEESDETVREEIADALERLDAHL